MENKKSRQFYFGNNADGNGIFPSLRFYRYQKILLRFSGSKVLEVFRWQHQCSGRLRGSLQRVVAVVSSRWSEGVAAPATSAGCTQVSRRIQSWMVGLDFHTWGVGIRISPGQLAANFWDEIPRTFGQSLFIKMIALSLPRRPSGVVLFTHQHRH
jgi:hypothetical protein